MGPPGNPGGPASRTGPQSLGNQVGQPLSGHLPIPPLRATLIDRDGDDATMVRKLKVETVLLGV
jgi:hypothetical protein